VLTDGVGAYTIPSVQGFSEFDMDIVTPDGTFAAYTGFPYRSGPPLMTAPIDGGSTDEIRLAGSPTDFELTTALK
jgi:hypothetical protein